MQTDFHASSRIVLGRGATDPKRALVTLSLVFVLVIIDSISVMHLLGVSLQSPYADRTVEGSGAFAR